MEDHDGEDPSPLEQELEALSAIYIDELTFDCNEGGQTKEINLLLHPATGNDTTKQFVCMNLVFHPTEKYPDEVPAISIRNPRGLGQEEVSSLVEDMKVKAEESVGEVMMYTLIEMAKDSLTEGNIPHCPCIVCLEHFDENSSFHRTACYHYFHNTCLHKYLEHVRAQQAEEEAENATRNLHHLQVNNDDKDKEIICPMCRCPLDEGTLAVQCVETDDDEEEAFVPSPALREQQKEMAKHFERQKAKGGIIDLEWERNKYLVNPEDRVFMRTSTQMSPEPNEVEKEKLEQGDPSVRETIKDDFTAKHQSQRPIQFYSNKSRNQKSNQRDHYYKDFRYRDHHRGQEYSSNRGSRGGQGNYRNGRENEQSDDQTDSQRKKTNQRYYNRERSNYGYSSDNSYDGPSGRRHENVSERSHNEENPEYSRYAKCGGWRGRGRGRGRERDSGYDESHNLGDSEKRSADSTAQTSENELSRMREDYGEDSLKQNGLGMSGRHFRNYDDFNGNGHQGYRTNYRDLRARCRGRENSSEQGGASYDGESNDITRKGGRCNQEKERDHEQHKSERGKPHRGKGPYNQKWQQQSYHPHQDNYGSHRDRNQWRREREVTGTRFSNDRRSNIRRREADDDDLKVADVEPVDEEKDEDGDMRNFKINQRWRNINSATKNIHHDVKCMPRKFGVIDDDYEDEKENSLVSDDEQVSEPDIISRKNPNYAVTNGHLDHYYPGFNQGLEEEDWEDEIDPYASEVTKYRREQLPKYFDYKKAQTKRYDDKLKERVQQENEVSEELRRIHKEQTKKQKRHDSERSEEENARSSGKSILEQFKGRQENPGSGSQEDCHTEKLKSQQNTPNIASSDATDAMPERTDYNQRKHSTEGIVNDKSDKASAQSEYQPKKASSYSGSAKDISWFGSKPPESFFHPKSSEGLGISENLIDNDAYEEAWQRRSHLEQKMVDKKCKMKSKRDINKNRAYREKDYLGKQECNERDGDYVPNTCNGQESWDRLSESDNFQCRKSEIAHNGHGPSLKTNAKTVIPPHREFKRPKPLDMKKMNGPAVISNSKNLDDVNSIVDGNCLNSKISSKSAFKKPKPLDFRKSNSCKNNSLHKPFHELTKDMPS